MPSNSRARVDGQDPLVLRSVGVLDQITGGQNDDNQQYYKDQQPSQPFQNQVPFRIAHKRRNSLKPALRATQQEAGLYSPCQEQGSLDWILDLQVNNKLERLLLSGHYSCPNSGVDKVEDAVVPFP